MFSEKVIKPFAKTVYLSSPSMHGEELEFMTEAFRTNWMSTVGESINEVERMAAEYVGCRYAVALSCGTAALHLCVKLAGVRPGDTVFCTDTTFAATVNPIVYEGGIPVFIDSERETWNMDPVALRRAFELYPDTKTVMIANLYGTPARLDEIRAICDEHGAIMLEDAAESLGSKYKGRSSGTFGAYNTISFNGNKIITGSSGGMVLTDDRQAAELARKWSTQSREDAPWYQHEEIGYNYRMSNVIASVLRGQYPHLEEHIAQKKAVYMRYREGFAGLPVSMNPYLPDVSEPNFWLSCLLIEPGAMCRQVRDNNRASYTPEKGKSCPTEILETLERYNAVGRPLWKPMHMQPVFASCGFVTALGDADSDVGQDIFARGLCLPSDNKMPADVQDKIIRIIRACFD